MAQSYRVLLVVFVMLFAVTVPAQEKKVKKAPAPYTSPASGKEMYEAYCASCHGKAGKGDGPAAGALKTPPADLTTISQRNGGNFPESHIYEVIRGEAEVPAHGSRDMPTWGPVFRAMSGGHQSEVQLRITNLTSYIKSLQAK